MSHVSKKTIAKYVEMCSTAGRVWTEGEIVSFRSLINTKLSDALDMREMIMECFYQSVELLPFQLEQVQQLKGLNWLRKTQLNSKGLLRNAATTFITELEVNVLENFDSCGFIGLADVATNSASGYRSYVPIYKCISASGAWFSYRATASGACRVIGRGTCASIALQYLKLAAGA